MKLVVFSDIHGNLPALDAFLEKIETLSYDALVFVEIFLDITIIRKKS